MSRIHAISDDIPWEHPLKSIIMRTNGRFAWILVLWCMQCTQQRSLQLKNFPDLSIMLLTRTPSPMICVQYSVSVRHFCVSVRPLRSTHDRPPATCHKPRCLKLRSMLLLHESFGRRFAACTVSFESIALWKIFVDEHAHFRHRDGPKPFILREKTCNFLRLSARSLDLFEELHFPAVSCGFLRPPNALSFQTKGYVCENRQFSAENLRLEVSLSPSVSAL